MRAEIYLLCISWFTRQCTICRRTWGCCNKSNLKGIKFVAQCTWLLWAYVCICTKMSHFRCSATQCHILGAIVLFKHLAWHIRLLAVRCRRRGLRSEKGAQPFGKLTDRPCAVIRQHICLGFVRHDPIVHKNDYMCYTVFLDIGRALIYFE